MHPLDEIGLTDMRELGGGGMTSPAIGLRQPWAGDGCVQGKQRLFLCMSEPEEAMGPPEFSRSVFPSQQGGADYALYISIYSPGFSDLPTALGCRGRNVSFYAPSSDDVGQFRLKIYDTLPIFSTGIVCFATT